MKYDTTKWHYSPPDKDSFVYYIPLLRYNARRLYGQPQRSRQEAHKWILENLPELEENDYNYTNSSVKRSNMEPETYVLHAGTDYLAKPSDLKAGLVEAWRDKEDARWTIKKRIDVYFYRFLRHIIS